MNGRLKIDLGRVKSERQAIAVGSAPCQLEDSKVAESTSRTCCVDPVSWSICDRNTIINELWNALDVENRPPTLAQSVGLNRQLNTATLASGKSLMYMLDPMTRVGEELTRLGTTVHPYSVLSTFVCQLRSEYSFQKQLLEGQEPDRDEI